MMAVLRSGGPYVWVTWLTRLLVGENSCEWAAWFRAQHEGWSWAKAPSGFDLVGWQLAHTAGVNENRCLWEERGYAVFTENQNSFALRGRTATLGGKPDLVALKGESRDHHRREDRESQSGSRRPGDAVHVCRAEGDGAASWGSL